MSGLHEMTRCIRQIPLSQLHRSISRPGCQQGLRRFASTQAAPVQAQPREPPPELADLESNSSLKSDGFGEGVKLKSVSARFYGRKRQLPGSKYQYHPPKYDRGPLHPIQSPPSSDPVARDFVPGPFNIPRLKQTYETTIASDLMTLAYQHIPPGEKPPSQDFTAARLREWDDSSPYHKNRPLRGPRGSQMSRLVEPDINFRNVPALQEVAIACYTPEGIRNENYLWVARAMLQAISGVVPETTISRVGNAGWGVIKGRTSGAKVRIRGEAAYEFLDKCIHLVFPRIKEWPGVKGTTGDMQGNLAFGLRPEDMALFPEIEANYSMYPPKILPGCRVFIKTSARSNRHARLLMRAMGMPFYGQLAS